MNPLRLRAKFLQLSNEKKAKYYQKSINKYVELLVNLLFNSDKKFS